jgi:hypothetical protein
MDETEPITNREDVIDSRTVTARIEYLSDQRDAGDRVGDDALDDHEAAELAALIALRDEAEGYADDWDHSATLIRDSYFKDYARDYAAELNDDHGDLDGCRWPYSHIDWDAAADELKMDYTSVAFGDVDYWTR